ncbi:diaminopimelate decarboxylase, partial [Dehalococcoidia bacterium]|nr:diaminopimelate decarboxylase [Dehalococcoidia bacterium]
LTNLAITKLLGEEGLGIEIVSGGELASAIASGIPPNRIYFHGNNKGRGELEEAVKCGVGRIVVDNFHELELLQSVAHSIGRVQDILIRVSPGVDPHTHTYITTGTLDSKFGIPIATGQAEQAVRRALTLPHLNPLGLHCHIGSQLLETRPYMEAIRITLEFGARMREEGFSMAEFSPGGGFGIAYTRDQKPPSVSEYAEAITSSLSHGCRELSIDQPAMTIEPGRAIVGRAGVAIYTVGARKEIPGVRKYISVDGGMGDNIRLALYQARYEAVVANLMDRPSMERVTIAGKFCESGDILVEDAELPITEPGDLIAIPASGAYCLPMSSNYNMATRPAIVLVGDGGARLIRRRETYQDLMATDVM